MRPLDLPDHLILLEDLGMQYATTNSKTKERFVTLQCLGCERSIRKAAYYAKKSTGYCQSCINSKTSTKHGYSSSKLYYVLNYMLGRCYNKNDTHYDSYGGKGIGICDAWRYSKAEFLDWAMKAGYKEGLTIDRINPEGDYEPNNCRWTNRKVQARNTGMSKNNTSGYRGVTKNGNNWGSCITVNHKSIWLGTYPTAVEAAKEFNNYVTEHKLEHTLNIIKGELNG